jgi:hypothetical protein
VFARQAAVAIRASRLERDAATLLESALTGDRRPTGPIPARTSDAVVADAVAMLAREDDGALWALADEIARLRAADPTELDLVRELLAVLVGGPSGRRRAVPAPDRR